MKTTHEIQGWFNHANAYLWLLNQMPDDGKFIELGAWLGKSTSYLCDHAGSKEIYVLDSWEGSPNEIDTNHSAAKTMDLFEVFKANMGSRNYIPLHGDSLEFAEKFEDEFFDVAFIDLTHTYEAVKQDIKAWLPKVKKGGYIAGDDYHPNWPEVIRAVDEVFPNRQIIDDAWIVKV